MGERNCPECGAGFSDPGVGKRGRPRRYCSEPCRRTARNRQTAEWRDSYSPETVFRCEGCGAHWCNLPGNGRGSTIWCTDLCRSRHQKRRERGRELMPWFECAGCGCGFRSWQSPGLCPDCRVRDQIPQAVRREIYERDDWKCWLCGEAVEPEIAWPDKMYPTVDHVVPRKYGGSDDPFNLRLAHWICNTSRGAPEPKGQLTLVA